MTADPSCTTAGASVDLAPSQQQAVFYARSSTAGTTQLDASAPGLSGASQTLQVTGFRCVARNPTPLFTG